MVFLRYSFVFLLLLFHFKILAAQPISAFSLKVFDETPKFSSDITLFGDAQIVNGSSYVEINRPTNFSSGRLIYRNPIKFFEGKSPRKPVSFSTYISFSISGNNGDGFAFVFLPSGFPLDLFDGGSFGLSPGLEKKGGKVLVVEFDTKMDAEHGDLNGNHVGIDVGSLVSVRVSNVSFKLNNGEKFQSWITYDASSKRLEVRLNQFGSKKPTEPLVSCQIDLYKMWKEEEVYVGISGSSGNSTQSTSIHSWTFWIRHVPTWFHSQPFDPNTYSDHKKLPPVQGRSFCLFRILTALIFGIGCGALAVFVVLLMKAMFATRHTVVVPVEYPVHPVEFEYKKIKLVVKNAAKDEGK